MVRKAVNIDIKRKNYPANIGVAGCLGRVGSLICKEIISGGSKLSVKLVGGTIQKDFPCEVDDIGTAINMGACGARIYTDPEELFKIADVVIDFTSPAAVEKHAELASRYKKAYVIGTTGLSEDHENMLEDASKAATIIYAPNMSVGVNLLLALAEKVADILDEEWDIEIFEAHHKHKVDAPSGTAIALGKACAMGRGSKLDDVADYERHGHTGEREKGNIGFSVARGGSVVGEHTVTFYGEAERIELGHIASDRSLFAKGALRAAKWACEHSPGLYSMRDVLEI